MSIHRGADFKRMLREANGGNTKESTRMRWVYKHGDYRAIAFLLPEEMGVWRNMTFRWFANPTLAKFPAPEKDKITCEVLVLDCVKGKVEINEAFRGKFFYTLPVRQGTQVQGSYPDRKSEIVWNIGNIRSSQGWKDLVSEIPRYNGRVDESTLPIGVTPEANDISSLMRMRTTLTTDVVSSMFDDFMKDLTHHIQQGVVNNEAQN